jgi:hypothetical protein
MLKPKEVFNFWKLFQFKNIQLKKSSLYKKVQIWKSFKQKNHSDLKIVKRNEKERELRPSGLQPI